MHAHCRWNIFPFFFLSTSLPLYIANANMKFSSTSNHFSINIYCTSNLRVTKKPKPKMASFHSRSNSFPSQSHPTMNDVEGHLERLNASQATSTSSDICANLASLKELHDGINNMIQMPSFQQELAHEQGQNWMNELLEGSLKLVDLCGFSRDIVQLTKESVQELESSIRRKSDDVSAYASSRKKINKMISKCVKNLKSSNKNSTALPTIGKMLKEAESLDSSILKSVLIILSGVNKEKHSNQKSWSLLSKLTKSGRVHSEVTEPEMSIEEIEEGLEALFRSLVKTRVSLLNVLSH